MTRDPQELYDLAQKMNRPRELYLKWKAVLERYETGKHSKFSECFLKASGETVKEKEVRAYASGEYQGYLAEWDAARKSFIKAQVEYDNLKCQWESLQSILSYQREEMKQQIRS